MSLCRSRYLSFLIILVSNFGVWSQEVKKTNLFVDLGMSYGRIIKTNDYVKGKNACNATIKQYYAQELRFGWQTLGTKQWQKDLHLPYYGVGLNFSEFQDDKFFGNPYALYFFLGGPFVDHPNYSFNYEFGFGVIKHWNTYDPHRDPYNIAIGSQHNVYIDIRAYYSRTINDRMDLQIGLKGNHFSNGKLKMPNKGLNILSPYVCVRYGITKHQLPQSIESEPTIHREEFNILYNVGYRTVVNTEHYNTHHAWLNCLTLERLWLGKKVWKYGVSFDLGIDQNKNVEVNGNGDHVDYAPLREQVFAGVAFAGQFRANRLAVQTDIGYELISHGSDSLGKRMYQKMGLRYYISDQFIAGIRIKAHHCSKADYIEWTLGYSFGKV